MAAERLNALLAKDPKDDMTDMLQDAGAQQQLFNIVDPAIGPNTLGQIVAIGVGELLYGTQAAAGDFYRARLQYAFLNIFFDDWVQNRPNDPAVLMEWQGHSACFAPNRRQERLSGPFERNYLGDLGWSVVQPGPHNVFPGTGIPAGNGRILFYLPGMTTDLGISVVAWLVAQPNQLLQRTIFVAPNDDARFFTALQNAQPGWNVQALTPLQNNQAHYGNTGAMTVFWL